MRNIYKEIDDVVTANMEAGNIVKEVRMTYSLHALIASLADWQLSKQRGVEIPVNQRVGKLPRMSFYNGKIPCRRSDLGNYILFADGNFIMIPVI